MSIQSPLLPFFSFYTVPFSFQFLPPHVWTIGLSSPLTHVYTAAIINFPIHHFDYGIPAIFDCIKHLDIFHCPINEGPHIAVHQDTPSVLNVLNPFLPLTVCLCHPCLLMPFSTLATESGGSAFISCPDWFCNRFQCQPRCHPFHEARQEHSCTESVFERSALARRGRWPGHWTRGDQERGSSDSCLPLNFPIARTEDDIPILHLDFPNCGVLLGRMKTVHFHKHLMRCPSSQGAYNVVIPWKAKWGSCCTEAHDYKGVSAALQGQGCT